MHYVERSRAARAARSILATVALAATLVGASIPIAAEAANMDIGQQMPGDVLVNKVLCPPGFDARSATYDEIKASCHETPPPIEFTLRDSAGSGTSRTSTKDGTFTATFNGVPNGALTIQEEDLPGYDVPRVFCGNAQLAGQTEPSTEVLVSGTIAVIEFKTGFDVLTCDWVNIPEPGSTASLQPTTGTTGTVAISIDKFGCADGFDSAWALEAWQQNCTATVDGAAFILQLPDGTLTAQALVGTNVAWTDLAPGNYGIIEQVPGEYVDSVVFCGSAVPTGSPVAYAPVEHRQNGIVAELAAGNQLDCKWFNVKTSAQLPATETTTGVVTPQASPTAQIVPTQPAVQPTDVVETPAIVETPTPIVTAPIFETPTPVTTVLVFETPTPIATVPVFETPTPIATVAVPQPTDPASTRAILITAEPTPQRPPVTMVPATETPNIGATLQLATATPTEQTTSQLPTAVVQTVTPDLATPSPTTPFTPVVTPPVGTTPTTDPIATMPATINAAMASLSISKYICPESYNPLMAGADPYVDCASATNGMTFRVFNDTTSILTEITGADGSGRIGFTDLRPGEYSVQETFPEGTSAAMVWSCESNLRNFDSPFAPLASIGSSGTIKLSLVEGELLACTWFDLPGTASVASIEPSPAVMAPFDVTVMSCGGQTINLASCVPASAGVVVDLVLATGRGPGASVVTDASGFATGEVAPGTYSVGASQTICFSESAFLNEAGLLDLLDESGASITLYLCDR